MDITAFLKSIEASGLATRIRDALWIFPLIESTHVIGLALVFGTIVIIDLRLLGIASTQRSFKRMASDILKWTWAAFELTAGRTIHNWDKASSAPSAGKAVAAVSLAMWIGIIIMGRLIGFTTTRA